MDLNFSLFSFSLSLSFKLWVFQCNKLLIWRISTRPWSHAWAYILGFFNCFCFSFHIMFIIMKPFHLQHVKYQCLGNIFIRSYHRIMYICLYLRLFYVLHCCGIQFGWIFWWDLCISCWFLHDIHCWSST